jgi:hypothetical protein
MRRAAIWIPILLLLSSACGDDAVTPPELTRLSQARARWALQGFDSYEITQRRNCFCMLGGRPVRLVVLRDSLVGGTNLEDSTALTEEQLSWYCTIDQLFDFIGTFDPAAVARYEAEFDSTHGFPAHFYVDRDTHIADEEIGYDCFDLHPLR